MFEFRQQPFLTNVFFFSHQHQANQQYSTAEAEIQGEKANQDRTGQADQTDVCSG